MRLFNFSSQCSVAILVISLSTWPLNIRPRMVSCGKTKLGYSRKYPTPPSPPPPPPHGRHLIGYPKISGFPRRAAAVYTGFETLLIQNLGEFQNFARFWMVFLEFLSKFTKFCGNSWNSCQAHRAFITGFRMSSMGGGGVWIFSGVAHCQFPGYRAALLHYLITLRHL